MTSVEFDEGAKFGSLNLSKSRTGSLGKSAARKHSLTPPASLKFSKDEAAKYSGAKSPVPNKLPRTPYPNKMEPSPSPSPSFAFSTPLTSPHPSITSTATKPANGTPSHGGTTSLLQVPGFWLGLNSPAESTLLTPNDIQINFPKID